jgi:hypothetical protein
MNAAQHQRVKDLFAAVVSLTPGTREEYLARQSADDQEVLAEVHDPAAFDEAMGLFETRQGLDFSPLWGGLDDGRTLWELHFSAAALGRDATAAELLARAREAGSTDAHRAK